MCPDDVIGEFDSEGDATNLVGATRGPVVAFAEATGNHFRGTF